MTWLETATSLAKKFEGCHLQAYPDPVYGWRVATIGYGATGPAIAQGTVWTQQQADADLTHRLIGIGEDIDRLVTVPLTDDQKAALADFIYNLGTGAFAGSTLLAKLNAGDTAAAGAEFPKWIYANGIELKGLVTRRAAEQALFVGKPQGKPEAKP
jgi:lysozyme